MTSRRITPGGQGFVQTPPWNGTAINPSQIIPTTLTVSNPAISTLVDAFKPNQAGKKKSHVVFVLDDSGSMQSCREATISGFNEYLETQKQSKKDTGIKTFVSLYKFDGYGLTCVHERLNVDKVQPLNMETYDPRGMTNLYDAIGGVMMAINQKLLDKKKDSVIINILTDGQENHSQTFSNYDVKLMIEKAEGANWGFMFMGANIDAFSVGGSLGFKQENTLQYDTKSMGSTFRSAGRMTNDMKMAYASGASTMDSYTSASFTDDERSASVSGDDNG